MFPRLVVSEYYMQMANIVPSEIQWNALSILEGLDI